MDLCSEEAVVQAEAGIRAINSSVTIVRTKHSAADWRQLLNRQGYKHGAAVELPSIAEVCELVVSLMSRGVHFVSLVSRGELARLQARGSGRAAIDCRGVCLVNALIMSAQIMPVATPCFSSPV